MRICVNTSYMKTHITFILAFFFSTFKIDDDRASRLLQRIYINEELTEHAEYRLTHSHIIVNVMEWPLSDNHAGCLHKNLNITLY